METLAFELADILDTVTAHGHFYATGTMEASAPILEVAGFGRVALPLLPAQAASLIAQAEPAPFGRGTQTIIDQAVRKSWQVAANRVQLTGRAWPGTLDAIINQAAAALGVEGPVAAERYKLLIDGPGCFFGPHRDTEKCDGMFATLVIVLPSLCEGGELMIRHQDQEVCLDLNRSEPDQLAYAAFYADCLHEMRPIRSGHRLTLIYNLLRYGDGPLPTLADQGDQVAKLSALLRAWGHATPPDAAPTKLLYPLEHAYTPAELDVAHLKPADVSTAATLQAAAGQADCELHLALLSIEESGSAEYCGSRRRSGRRYWDDDGYGYSDDGDFEIGEIIDSSYTLSHWRRFDGAPATIQTLPFTRDELCPPDLFDDMEPDEQHFQGSTGNDGASFERSYQRAVLAIWPRAQQLAVLAQGGLEVTLPLLEEALQQWQASVRQRGEIGQGEIDQADKLWQAAHRLAGFVQAGWRKSHAYPSRAHADHASRFLRCLVPLRDQALISAFLHDIAADGIYDGGENPALVAALAVLDADAAAAALEPITRNAGRRNVMACADLLRQIAGEPALRGTGSRWHPAAQHLLEHILNDTPGSAANGWAHPVTLNPDLLADTLEALAQLAAPQLAGRLLDKVLAKPQHADMDRLLLPAALMLATRTCRDDACVTRLRTACLAHLQRRIAQELVPPTDLARPAKLSCSCNDCRELARFLADPLRERWVFAAAEYRRNHVAGTVRQDQCDLNLQTLTERRPYSLMATKNQADYQRRVVQRQRDLADVAVLRA